MDMTKLSDLITGYKAIAAYHRSIGGEELALRYELVINDLEQITSL